MPNVGGAAAAGLVLLVPKAGGAAAVEGPPKAEPPNTEPAPLPALAVFELKLKVADGAASGALVAVVVAPKLNEGLESAGLPNWNTPVLAAVVAAV